VTPVVLGTVAGQEAELAYLLWRARQVADQQGSGAVAVGGEGRRRKRVRRRRRKRRTRRREVLLDFAVHELNRDMFSELMEYMG
jgi:hypothetical protein